jgi:glutathione synthase
MRIAFFVNDLETERDDYTTTRLALAAHARGHDVWYLGAEDLATLPDSSLTARAAALPGKKFRSLKSLLAAAQAAERETLPLEELDVFWLRSDPADETDRPWARHIGIDFGHVLADRGVIVLNDPDGLRRAANKMYVQLLPSAVRPRTLITHDLDAVRAFMKDEDTDIVLKPLHGSRGENVFMIRRDDGANLNQIFEAIASSGYVIAQEYLADAAKGDIRMFLLNGRPLAVDGSFAAFRRVNTGPDMRNNMSVGGQAKDLRMTDAILAVAESVRPKLVEDGMFLVGVDLAGDRILEVNVFSPGGIGSCEHFSEVDYSSAIIEAVEAKCDLVGAYGRTFANRQIAVL